MCKKKKRKKKVQIYFVKSFVFDTCVISMLGFYYNSLKFTGCL